MFIIDQSPSYTWPVSFETPEDNGLRKKHTFTAKFKRLTQTDMEAMIHADGVTDKGLAKGLLIGWHDIKDEKQQDVPFTTATFEQLLDVPGVANAIVMAFLDSIADAKRKN